jgi:hypothetical protein
MVLFSIVLVLGMAGAASAVTLTDVTLFTATGTTQAEDYVSHGWGDVNFLSPPTEDPLHYDYVAWEHKFTFSPPAYQIISGTLKLYLRNEPDEFAWVYRMPEQPQYAFAWMENAHWNIGQVDDGTYPHDVNVNFLADGVLNMRIASGGGDFYIDKSELTINYNPVSVPEPSTMLLLGPVLVGLAGIRRKFKK